MRKPSRTSLLISANQSRGAHRPFVSTVRRKPRRYQAACRNCNWRGTPGSGTHAQSEAEAHSRETLPAGAAPLSIADARVDYGTPSKLRRIQIHIQETLDRAAEAEAARRGISKAALIRVAVDHELHPAQRQESEAWKALTGWLEDGGVGDIDEVIYGPHS